MTEHLESEGACENRCRLGVIILNFRTPRLVIDCLEALAGEVEPGRDEVVVVDNESGDGSACEIAAEVMRRGWDGWARVVEAGRNGGFSAGNNAGIRASDAEYYLLLNSDTLVRPGAVGELLWAAEALPRAGLIGPRLEFPDTTGQVSAFRVLTPLSQFERSVCMGVVSRILRRHVVAMGLADHPHRADWVSFACVLVRRSCLEKTGPMDEGMFMYFEDIDFANRARRAGFEVWHWPLARVVHLRGGSSEVKRSTAARKRLPGYFYAARSRYLFREFGISGVIGGNLLWSVGSGLCWMISLLPGRSFGHPLKSWRDVWSFVADTPAGKRGVFIEPDVEPLFARSERAADAGDGHGRPT